MLKEFNSRLVVAGGFWLLYTVSAFAEEIPSSDIVYNTKEASSLVYLCERSQEGSLECDFTQTRVHKKAEAKDLKSSFR